MAEKDNNHHLWKWEYIPFLKKSIELGVKLKEIDEAFNSETYRKKNVFTNNSNICSFN